MIWNMFNNKDYNDQNKGGEFNDENAEVKKKKTNLQKEIFIANSKSKKDEEITILFFNV